MIEFVTGLDAACLAALDDALVATYLHGSAALGGFVPGRSDLDVLFVTSGVVDDRVLVDAAEALRSAANPCPGRGVELSIVTASAARRPASPWPFLLHLTTEPADETMILGSAHAGDPDLLMHYVVCRAAGVAVRGPQPAELIGPVDRRDVLAYLDHELGWALDHASEAYAVLNACRARRYLECDQIVSKVDGARYLLEYGGPEDLITAALAAHVGERPHHPPSEPARRFVTDTRNDLRTQH